jgi:NAD(P)-dependent dehydrogenase (short-subunit alcohol dehydrogenase family)
MSTAAALHEAFDAASEIGGLYVKCNVASEEDGAGAVAAASEIGPLPVLVNSAGLGRAGRTVSPNFWAGTVQPGSRAGIVTCADTQTAQYAELNEWLQRRLSPSVLDVAGRTP